jgi:hypothetical protein
LFSCGTGDQDCSRHFGDVGVVCEEWKSWRLKVRIERLENIYRSEAAETAEEDGPDLPRLLF